MIKNRVYFFSLVFLFLLCFGICFGKGDEPTKRHSVKANYFLFGFQERCRTEDWNNILDFSDSNLDIRHQWRFRTRAWLGTSLGKRIYIYFCFNNEAKKITAAPSHKLHVDELIIENAYIDIKLSDRFSFRFGRQNLMRGEGFIIFDGNPLDGSRSAYFNALDITFHYTERGKIEIMGISNSPHDIYLPKIHNKHRQLVEWDEKAFALYLTQELNGVDSLEGYYFYKKEAGTHNFRHSEKRISTLGARNKYQFGCGYSLCGEFAYQWGRQHPDKRIRAWGGYMYGKKVFDMYLKPEFIFGYWVMSGDDPKSNHNEEWDPLFSRWPKWSELYIYSLLNEKGVAYWSNIGMWQLQVLFHPIRQFLLRSTYYHMRAFHPENNPKSIIFGRGKCRGDLLQFRLDIKLGMQWKCHLLYEDLFPGNFYSHRDNSYFFRFEFTYTFDKKYRFVSL